jgi:probable rRNA maturation factor
VITVAITNRQNTLPIDRPRIRRVVGAIVRNAGIAQARVGVAVVDDMAIAKLHAEFLNDPDPTDVLSFVLERSQKVLEGEVVVSADTAKACAPRYRCTADDELLRYVIHGTLHLVGYDDMTPKDRTVMRREEKKHLAKSQPSEIQKKKTCPPKKPRPS